MDVELRPICRQIAKAFDVAIFQVEEALGREPNAAAVAAFCAPDGPLKLLVYSQRSGKGDDEEVHIYVSSGESDQSMVETVAEPGLMDSLLRCLITPPQPIDRRRSTMASAGVPDRMVEPSPYGMT